MADKLEEYRRKRARERTPEPWPEGPPVAGGNDLFVIQEHHASRLHWDFRLERDGVLVSWAVPKGLPRSPGVTRLAVHTEDHPMEYLDFEGEIPAGEYGGGWMAIWDTGRYETLHWNDHKVEVVFHGGKANGKYLFLNRHNPEDEGDWTLRRLDPAEDGHEDSPEFLEPMAAVPGELPAEDDDWAYEFDWGGARTMLCVSGGRIAAHDETGADVIGRWPELHKLGETLGSTEVLLDGEMVVVCDGRPDPAGLARRSRADGSDAKRMAKHCPAFFFAYDLLHYEGRATLDLPYLERRDMLADLGLSGGAWQVPRYFRGGGEAVLAAAREHGLGGIYAKRADGDYRPGKADGDWLRIST
ncbi:MULTISPECIES: DNA polymerase ligase N-terminal domain-containing protein [unclassified Amycolatopsis]|uniref:DNA polymerase ligase N-terminal domain-containing protein n=1 Tax=unclassified Amycolatopsis TaxID=2618356 RepID=UPI0028755CDB|nr:MULTISPECIES: DNA polymerase ligase N-terminal domain-containing protein [unclassified Amycolatopsis]MDS0134836.1 ATP-dependent DNA ligase [Amycolatopsis sp. 505]MDS0147988.1 ATP-dependent DNA ligase [Amycolatopsis sp. CM201R]